MIPDANLLDVRDEFAAPGFSLYRAEGVEIRARGTRVSFSTSVKIT